MRPRLAECGNCLWLRGTVQLPFPEAPVSVPAPTEFKDCEQKGQLVVAVALKTPSFRLSR